MRALIVVVLPHIRTQNFAGLPANSQLHCGKTNLSLSLIFHKKQIRFTIEKKEEGFYPSSLLILKFNF